MVNSFTSCRYCRIYTCWLRKEIWTSSFIAELSTTDALYPIPVRQYLTFAVRLPSDSSSRRTPLSLANDSSLSRLARDFNPIVYEYAWHTKKTLCASAKGFVLLDLLLPLFLLGVLNLLFLNT